MDLNGHHAWMLMVAKIDSHLEILTQQQQLQRMQAHFDGSNRTD